MSPFFLHDNPLLLACDLARGWCVFAFADGRVQLDFGPAACLLPATEFPKLTALIGECQDMAGQTCDATRRCRAGTVCFIAQHQIFTLIASGAVLRFRPAEFAALSELLQDALFTMTELLSEERRFCLN
ncbi:MAG: hypothetical protein K6U78_11480 [Anaerolineae bacterium]|nr:hypothetical protein [Anaerolineae bacterium]